LRRYFSKLSPIGRVSADARGVCGVDLARATGTIPNESMSFRAYVYRGAELAPAAKGHFRSAATPQVCVDVAHGSFPEALPADAPERYVVVDITNGYAPGPLRAHLYDLGEREGYRLVGVERPAALKRPD
jgi:hypothetical protein